jgi:hypothetical protein
MIAPAFYVSLVPAAERSAHLAVGACAIQMAQICAGQMAQICAVQMAQICAVQMAQICAGQMAQICAGQMAQISERPVYRGLLRASAGSFGSRKAEALSASDTRS